MCSHKRDRTERAFEHGFRAGVKGRSMEQCPYISLVDLRGAWLSGWREGREQYITGNIPVRQAV